jgi:hypothetical protein
MNVWNQHWECTCGWTGHEDEFRAECVFHGNREEPPEYEAYCPDCGANADQMSEVEMLECPACSEIALPGTGGECIECHSIAHF